MGAIAVDLVLTDLPNLLVPHCLPQGSICSPTLGALIRRATPGGQGWAELGP